LIIYVWGKITFGGRGGGKLPSIIFILKPKLKLSISNQMSVFKSLYENPFHKNLICPRVTTYNPCPQIPGGCFDPNYFSYDHWTIFDEMTISKFLLDTFEKKWT
jgi:hypothetical protein